MSLKVQPRAEVAEFEAVKARPGGEMPKPAVQEAKSSGEEVSLEEIVDPVEIEAAVDSINGAIEPVHRGLRFVVHEATNRILVRVMDIKNDEVIKEIPPEEVLDTVARIREMIGVLIDERA